MNARIAILICTHDRPQLLRNLLEGLRAEWQDGVLLAIVDNGTVSSEPVIAPFREHCEISYLRSDRPGLVAARNACIELALRHAPDFLVFIDDDEAPRKGWLANLLRSMQAAHADFATGPVEPEFLVPPPAWAVQGAYFEDNGHSYRTSNLMIRAATLPREPGNWFQEEFNFLGGEDSELLSRLVAGGAIHAVAQDAVVVEFIPAERLRRRYIWRRGTRDGAVIAEIIFARHGNGAWPYVLCMAEIAKKIGYACNHIFWTWREPWRINNALCDFHAAAGVGLRMAGVRMSFYGTRREGRADVNPS